LGRGKELIVPWHGFALVNGALMAWEVSFMFHDGPLDRFPTRYRWWLFLLGVALAGAGYVLTWYRNLSPRQSAGMRRRSSSLVRNAG
jgi:peptidoglycan/LPS O-acetylase OafA/YrhL